MPHPLIPGAKRRVPVLLLTLLLAACGDDKSDSNGSDRHAHDHDHDPVETLGRLATYDSDASAVKIIDLDDGSLLGEFPLTGVAPSLYASPGLRYAVVIQRNDNLVSFIDGGLYQEDHGDHLHDYAESPALMGLTLSGVRPTHYSPVEDYAVVFHDGGNGSVSSVDVISDSAIAAGALEGSLSLENAMHGVAKRIGDKLFVSYRDPSITDTTLPAEVERYQWNGSGYDFEERYSVQCPLLHGAGHSERHLVFGCGDGVLVVDLADSTFAASKLGNPDGLAEGARIGTVLGHHAWNQVVGIAGTQLFTIEPDVAEPYQALTLPGAAVRLSQGFVPTTGLFWVMADDGALHLFDPAAHWNRVAAITVTGAIGASDPRPVVTASGADARLFVLLPASDEVVEVDLDTRSIAHTRALGFNATTLAWLGIPGEHDH